MESAYEGFEMCSVCFELYNDDERQPKILPCTHAVCLSCIKGFLCSSFVKGEQSSASSSSSGKAGIFQEMECPFCRKSFLLSEIQDNHYILVHLRKVIQMKSTPEASAPPKHEVYDDSAEKVDGTLKWCIKCEEFPSGSCGSHLTIPLSQFIESKKDSVQMILSELEMKLFGFSFSINGMTKVLDDVSSALQVTLKEFETVKKNTTDLTTLVKTLKSSCEMTTVPSEENLLTPYAKLFQKIGVSSEWLSNYMTQLESKISVENLYNGSFMMNTNYNKFLVSSKSSINSFEALIKKN